MSDTFDPIEHFESMGGLLKVYQTFAPADALAIWLMTWHFGLIPDHHAEEREKWVDKYLDKIGTAIRREEMPTPSISQNTAQRIEFPVPPGTKHELDPELWEHLCSVQQHVIVSEWDFFTSYLKKYPNPTDELRLKTLTCFLVMSA